MDSQPPILLSSMRPIACAHQAGNDLQALAAAEAAGADLFETDVWLHRGRLEVRHNKTMGPVPLLWDSWSLQPGWRPRLELQAVVESAQPDTVFMLDLKGRDRRLSGAVIEAMRNTAPGRPYAVCSPNWDLLDPFVDEPGVRVVHSICDERALRTVRDRVRNIQSPAVSVDFRLLTPERVADLRACVDLAIAWTINTPDDARRALEWGINGITTDSLDVLRHVLAAPETTPAGGGLELVPLPA